MIGIRRSRAALSHVLWVGVLSLLSWTVFPGGLGAVQGAEPGDRVKLRILVDKVMQPVGDWHTEEWMVAEAAEAGFNVYSPRIGFDDLEEVRRVTTWCKQYGIYHMPWMRGSLAAPEDSTAAGRRLVWSAGNEQPLWSPNSDELWAWMTRYITEYARMAAVDTTLIGVFLDYENYAPGIKGGNLYDLSYDRWILERFAEARGETLPDLTPAERSPWLEEKGWAQDFAEFQIAHWRSRCRALRQAVDQYAPGFRFCIYPAPGTLFMTEATYPEWATPSAPLILADASIYGRPGLWTTHEEALASNHTKLAERMARARGLGEGPFQYAGGLDPAVSGADPEFCGRNAVMSADLTDGYWVFYEGPTYEGTHRAYFDWFTRANRAIEDEDWDFWRRPRETPDTFGLTELHGETDRPQMIVHDARPHLTRTLEELDLFEIHPMAGHALSYLQGARVVVLQNFNESLAADHPFVQALRQYVEDGGGLLLGHDTAWFMASPFPEIAQKAIPTRRVEAGRHVVDTELVTCQVHPALGSLPEGTRFSTEFYDHMIFQPGPEGVVLIRNTLGDPVYVAGRVGKGRVVFSGCYYGYERPLEGVEREVLHQVIRWLANE